MEMLHGPAFGSTKLLFKKQKQAIKIIPMEDIQNTNTNTNTNTCSVFFFVLFFFLQNRGYIS